MQVKVNLLGDYIGKYILSALEYLLMAAIGVSLISLVIWKIFYV